jgi:hypothetical protein
MPYIGKQPASVPVTADDIPNDSITSAKILDNVITIADIGPNAVGSSEMADDAIGLNELSATGTTNSSTFLRGDNTWAVPYAIQDGQLSQNNFTNDDHTKLNNIETAATADQTAAQIKTHLENGIDSVHYVDRSVDAVHIAANTITANEVAANAIGTSEIIDDAVTAAKLANSINTAIAANTAKTGITSSQATAITAALPKAGGAMTGDLDVQANITADQLIMGDNQKIKLGNSGDLEMYHNAGDSYIADVGDGGIKILTAGVGDSGFYKVGGEKMATFEPDASVTLYHDNNIRLVTTNAGATLTGNLTLSALPATTVNAYVPLSFRPASGVISGDSALTWNPAANTLDVSGTIIAGNYIRSTGSNSMQLGSAGAGVVMSLTSAGNVGIGTAAPAAKLDIKKTSGAGYAAYIVSSVNASGSDNGLFIGGYDEHAGSKLLTVQSNTITPDDGSYHERLVVQADGKVGIGRIPAALLHLQDTSPEIRFTYTGNSGYSYIKGGADNDLKFSTGTTTGTERMQLTGGGILNQFSGTAIQNGLSLYRHTGSINASTVVVNVDHTIGNGSGNVALVEAVYSHHGMSSYGCAYMAYIACYNGSIVSETVILDLTSGNGGSWVCTTPTAGTLRVTKNAGSYAGGGEWFVKVTSQVR